MITFVDFIAYLPLIVLIGIAGSVLFYIYYYGPGLVE